MACTTRYATRNELIRSRGGHQLLYGIRRTYSTTWQTRGYRVGVYIPFGSTWYPYLMRRMAERPANLLFLLRAAVGR